MKYILYTVLLLTFSLLSSCNDSGKQEYEMAISKGEQAYQNKQYVRALSFYKQAFKLMPQDRKLKKRIDSLQIIIQNKNEKGQLMELIKAADSLFEVGEYIPAKEKYRQANLIDPDDKHLQERLSEIESILISASEEEDNSPPALLAYHIIVGSFSIPANAAHLQQKLIQDGYRSILISRPHGFRAVSMLRYQDIHQAFNNLNEGKKYAPDAWILKY